MARFRPPDDLFQTAAVPEPNGIAKSIHDKAMPVMLMTAEAVDIWMNGTLEEALKLQKPQPDDTLAGT